MIEKHLRDIYRVDTLSQDKGWDKVNRAVEELLSQQGSDEELLIDFEGIYIIDPWTCSKFKELLHNNRVHMLFVNNPSLVNRIKMMCIIDGLDESRVIHREKEIKKEETAEEKKIRCMGTELIPLFYIEDNTYKIDLASKYSQIGNVNTIYYCKYAIDSLLAYQENEDKQQNITNFVIITKKINIQPHVLQLLAEIVIDYESNGITVQLDSDMDDICNNMSLYLHKASTEQYTEQRKFKFLLSKLCKDMPGILIKYKKSRAVDDFGRHGKGEVVSSRIAIFKGFKQSEDGRPPSAIFESYNNNYFYTKIQWYIEHDCEEPEELVKDTVLVSMEELGFGDYFLGSQYHFIEPIQVDKQESRNIIIDTDENGRNLRKLCTIPERMKFIFDDWEVKYNKDMLDKAIAKTIEKIGQD